MTYLSEQSENLVKEKEAIFALPGKASDISASSLLPRQKDILKVLEEGIELNIISIQTRLSKHIPIRTLQKDLAYLKELGFVNSIGKGKNLVWKKSL